MVHVEHQKFQRRDVPVLRRSRGCCPSSSASRCVQVCHEVHGKLVVHEIHHGLGRGGGLLHGGLLLLRLLRLILRWLLRVLLRLRHAQDLEREPPAGVMQLLLLLLLLVAFPG